MSRPLFTLFVLAVMLAGCANGLPPENISPGAPAVEVIQPDEGPLVLQWDPPTALWVELRHSESGEIVWRASAGGTRVGPRSALVESPLRVEALGPPPNVNPPDGRGTEARALQPLEPGQQYTVFVAPCAPPGSAPDNDCGGYALQQTTFTALRSYE